MSIEQRSTESILAELIQQIFAARSGVTFDHRSLIVELARRIDGGLSEAEKDAILRLSGRKE